MSTNFGELLRNLRKDRDMTLRDVEKETKISNAYLSQVESGKRNIPNLNFIVRLAKVYGTDPNELLEAAMTDTYADMVKHGAEHVKKLNTETKDVPSPDGNFIVKNYENLSETGKNQLKDYLLFLVNNEGKTKK